MSGSHLSGLTRHLVEPAALANPLSLRRAPTCRHAGNGKTRRQVFRVELAAESLILAKAIHNTLGEPSRVEWATPMLLGINTSRQARARRASIARRIATGLARSHGWNCLLVEQLERDGPALRSWRYCRDRRA